MSLVRVTPQGLYCEAGDFYVDPWKPVEQAVITHVHADHARTGSHQYYATHSSIPLMQHRLGENNYSGKAYGEKFKMGPTWVSLHPAGHILGSAQVRIEHKDEVWVLSGDYKRTFDPSCQSFEVVPCEVFVSEATFALPIYKWQTGALTAKHIFDWWKSEPQRPSIVFCYSLGKAQRILAELKAYTDQTVYLHGAAQNLTEIYRQQNIEMLPTKQVTEAEEGHKFLGDLILAPPSAHRSTWMKRFKDPQTAFASGWMQVRGARRRKGYEKGFVLSDHADWNELNQTISQTKASTVYLTHGKTDVLQRFLEEKGLTVKLFETDYEDSGEPQ